MIERCVAGKECPVWPFCCNDKLNELNYLEAAKFYPDKTPYDKAAHYAVFGGSPFVNQALQPTATIRENIISTILNYECCLSLCQPTAALGLLCQNQCRAYLLGHWKREEAVHRN